MYMVNVYAPHCLVARLLLYAVNSGDSHCFVSGLLSLNASESTHVNALQ